MSITRHRIARQFARQAEHFDAHAILHQQVSQCLLARLDYLRATPTRILDLGCNTGFTSQLLQQRYPEAQLIGVDIAEQMLRHARTKLRSPSDKLHDPAALSSSHPTERPPESAALFINADAIQLPLHTHSIDLIFSSLVWPWLSDLPRAWQEIKRVLKPDGVLCVATYGPDTLKEISQCYANIDHYQHVNQFMDMHNFADSLLQLNFRDPVVDMEYFCLAYPSIRAAFKELKAIGANCVLNGARKTLMGKHRFQQFEQLYEQRYRHPTEHYIPLNFEVVYALAFAPQTDSYSLASGEIAVPISSIKRN